MPKVKWLSSAKEPPIDWLKALIYERMDVKGYSIRTLAEDCGVGYDAMRRMMTKSPWDWTQEKRTTVCKALGISAENLKQTAGY